MSALLVFNVDNPSEIHFRPILRSFVLSSDTKFEKSVQIFDPRYTWCHTSLGLFRNSYFDILFFIIWRLGLGRGNKITSAWANYFVKDSSRTAELNLEYTTHGLILLLHLPLVITTTTTPPKCIACLFNSHVFSKFKTRALNPSLSVPALAWTNMLNIKLTHSLEVFEHFHWYCYFLFRHFSQYFHYF